MKRMLQLSCCAALITADGAGAKPQHESGEDATVRAERTLAEMTQDEKISS